MREITITANDAGRRLDRFLRKYLSEASLGEVYKYIRKDVKVDGKRKAESYILNEGDLLTLYISDDDLTRLSNGRFAPDDAISTKGAFALMPAAADGGMNIRNFDLVYEDDEMLIANKPYGLLTHGDSREKKDHLANRVKNYLIASGAYDPRTEKVFTPAPVNRLDRNTTGIVIFGKTSEAMRELTRKVRNREIDKFYLTIACGIISEKLHLKDSLLKDEDANRVKILRCAQDDQTHPGDSPAAESSENAKEIETIVTPLEYMEFGDGFSATLCMTELVTGRSHQIRAHLASAGHPLIGDSKYALKRFAALNDYCRRELGLSTQLLHAYRVEFDGRSFKSPMPARFADIFWKLYG